MEWTVGSSSIAVESDDFQAYEPSIVNVGGELQMFFPTGLDGGDPDAALMQTSSADWGRSWSVPAALRKREFFPHGGVSAAVGVIRLASGVILLPFTEVITHERFTRRESRLVVARSHDGGATWDRMDNAHAQSERWSYQFAYGRIVELDDRLLLPWWGAPAENPSPAPSAPTVCGVLESQDHGVTWSDSGVIANDRWAVFRHGAEPMPMGPNETSVIQLHDGRLLAVFRYEKHRHPRGLHLYRSHSSDNGRTWTVPVQMPIQGASPALHRAPNGDLLLGYRNCGDDNKSRFGSLRLSVSRDDGRTWSSGIFVDPPGSTDLNDFYGSYPDFADLPDGRVLVVFMSRTNGRFKIASAVLEGPASPPSGGGESMISVIRADHDGLPFYAASVSVAVTSGETLAQKTYRAAEALGVRSACRLEPAGDHVSSPEPAHIFWLIPSAKPPQGRPLVGYRDNDVDPRTGELFGWDARFSARVDFDDGHRSLGVILPDRCDRDGELRLQFTADEQIDQRTLGMAVWVSADNFTFSRIDNALRVHTPAQNTLQASLDLGPVGTSRYLKLTFECGSTPTKGVRIDDTWRDVAIHASKLTPGSDVLQESSG